MTPRPKLLPPVSRRAGHIGQRAAWALVPGDRELPRYFIVGAKRAGTTSLDEYLIDHPLVLRGLVEKGCRYYDVNYHKGPRWFRHHLPLARHVDRLERALGQRPILGESSPYYAFHPEAAARIARDVPDARLIFVLREPVQRAWSHYRYEVARGFETLGPTEALLAERARLAEGSTADREFAHRHFSYLGRSMYADQLVHLRAHFPSEAVLVVESERLFADPVAVMSEVFAHVGLPDHRQARYLPHKPLPSSTVDEGFAAVMAEPVARDAERLRQLLASPPSWV